jgi:hypothetical protein
MTRAVPRRPFIAVLLACAALSPSPGRGHAQAGAQEANRPLGAECPPSESSRIVVPLTGIVRDRRADAPLPDARVALRYRDERRAVRGEAVETLSDEDGRYLLCNLTAFSEATVTPFYVGIEGEETRVRLDRAQEIDLEVDLGESAYLVFSVVSAETGAPVQGASVRLSPIPLGGVTDSLGRVGLRHVPPGSYGLEVRHIAFATQEDSLEIAADQLSEIRVDLTTQVLAVEPLRVTITGRDPVLIERGFYERKAAIEEGYFGTHEEIVPYTMFRTLFRFRREFVTRYDRGRVYLLDGRPITRLGYDASSLNEIAFRRVRGVEAFPCVEAPPRLWNQLLLEDLIGLATDECTLVLIWTR